MRPLPFSRREFCRVAAGALVLAGSRRAATAASAASAGKFQLNYVLASSLYGRMPIADVLAEVRPAGSAAIDIWPEKHANQREQIEEMGHDRFAALLAQHRMKVGVYTCFNRGTNLADWMKAVKKFGGDLVVIGMSGPAGLTGGKLKQAIQEGVKKMQPDIDQAAELGVRLAIENHSGFLATPESVRVLAETLTMPNVGIAYAPYHLPQDAGLQAQLIREAGRKIMLFYAWEHGDGSSLLPVAQQMKQLPGHGPLDFVPLLGALKAVDFRGWTSIFMHPSPRGKPMLPTAREITAAINRSREYIDACLGRI